MRLLFPLRPCPAISYLLLSALPSLAQTGHEPSRPLIDTVGGSLIETVATDMDGDGDMDVLAYESNGARVLWWENDGTGKFSRSREWLTGDFRWTVVGLVDWDGDGRPDVWMRYYESDLSGENVTCRYYVAPNDGAGSFEEPVMVMEDDFASGHPIIVDMNGDSLPDIVTPWLLFLADGNGGFRQPPVKVVTADRDEDFVYWMQKQEVMIGDVDGDGLPDLMAGNIYSLGRLNASRNLGPDGFALFPNLLPDDPDGEIYRMYPCLLPAQPGGIPARLFIIEHGATDLSQTLRIYDIDADFQFTESTSLRLQSGSPGEDLRWSQLVCDPVSRRVFISSQRYAVSGEERSDPSTGFYEVTVEGGAVELREIDRRAGYSYFLEPSMADFDGDSVPDLLLTSDPTDRPSRIQWNRGAQDGTLEDSPETVFLNTLTPRLAAVVDLEGDGMDEVLIEGFSAGADFPNMLEVLRNGGADGYFDRQEISHDRDAIEVLATVDLEGGFRVPGPSPDGHGVVHTYSLGRPDFLVQTYQRSSGNSFSGLLRFEWLVQSDDGSFHWRPLTSEAAAGLAGLAGVTYTDWDGDGTRDLIYHASTEIGYSRLRWRRGTATGFGAYSNLFPSAQRGAERLPPPQVMDIDRDGDLDLVASGNLLGGYSTYWYENGGNGSMVSIRNIAAAYLEMIPDVDGDGHADLLGWDELYLSRPGVTWEKRTSPRMGGQYRQFLDIEGDGDPDFLESRGDSSSDWLQWRENLGGGRFLQGDGNVVRLPSTARWGEFKRVMTGDLDGDGVMDLVASFSNPRLEWFRGTRVAEPPAFTAWMEAQDLRGHSAGPLSDRDGDGLVNWGEFAFGSDAAVSDPGHAGRPRMVTGQGGPFFTFLKRSDAADVGLSYERQRSTDLDEWLPWSGEGVSERAGEGYERVTLPVPAGGGREFFRVTLGGAEEP